MATSPVLFLVFQRFLIKYAYWITKNSGENKGLVDNLPQRRGKPELVGKTLSDYSQLWPPGATIFTCNGSWLFSNGVYSIFMKHSISQKICLQISKLFKVLFLLWHSLFWTLCVKEWASVSLEVSNYMLQDLSYWL